LPVADVVAGWARGGGIRAGSSLYVVQAGLVSRHRASELVRRPRPPGAGLPEVNHEVSLYGNAGSPRPGDAGGLKAVRAWAGGCGYAAIAAVWGMVPAAMRRSQAVRLVVTL
jgi:hypothetical protein